MGTISNPAGMNRQNLSLQEGKHPQKPFNMLRRLTNHAISLQTSDLSESLPRDTRMLGAPRQNLTGADGTTTPAGQQGTLDHAPRPSAISHESHGDHPQHEIPSPTSAQSMTPHANTPNGHAKSAAENNETSCHGDAVMNSGHMREISPEPVQYQTPERTNPRPPVHDLTTSETGRHRPTSPSINHAMGAGLPPIHSSRVSKHQGEIDPESLMLNVLRLRSMLNPNSHLTRTFSTYSCHEQGRLVMLWRGLSVLKKKM